MVLILVLYFSILVNKMAIGDEQQLNPHFLLQPLDRFCPSVWPSLSHAGIMPKRLQLRSCGLHWRIATWLVSSRLTPPRNSKENMGN